MPVDTKVTTRKIAETLGLSQSTVSQILNGTPGLRFADETRKRVFTLAQEVGYQAQFMRRAIKKSLKHIGFVVNNPQSLKSTFMSEIINGIREKAAEENYLVMLCEANWELGNAAEAERSTRDLIDLVRSRILDGLVIDKSRFADMQIMALEKAGVPFVLVNGRLPKKVYPHHRQANWVSINHRHGGWLATTHLIQSGHQRIGMINTGTTGYPLHYLPGYIHYPVLGYQTALRMAKLSRDPALIVEGSLTDKGVITRAVDKLIDLPDRPTAIFAADDAMAIIAINHLHRRGLHVPEDISVMGYGHWSVSFVSDPELTTIDVPWMTMGQLGAKMLLDHLGDNPVNENIIVLKSSLVKGESVSSPRR